MNAILSSHDHITWYDAFRDSQKIHKRQSASALTVHLIHMATFGESYLAVKTG